MRIGRTAIAHCELDEHDRFRDLAKGRAYKNVALLLKSGGTAARVNAALIHDAGGTEGAVAFLEAVGFGWRACYLATHADPTPAQSERLHAVVLAAGHPTWAAAIVRANLPCDAATLAGLRELAARGDCRHAHGAAAPAVESAESDADNPSAASAKAAPKGPAPEASARPTAPPTSPPPPKAADAARLAEIDRAIARAMAASIANSANRTRPANDDPRRRQVAESNAEDAKRRRKLADAAIARAKRAETSATRSKRTERDTEPERTLTLDDCVEGVPRKARNAQTAARNARGA